MVHKVAQAVVCFLLFAVGSSPVEQTGLCLDFLEELGAEEGEFVVTEHEAGVLGLGHLGVSLAYIPIIDRQRAEVNPLLHSVIYQTPKA